MNRKKLHSTLLALILVFTLLLSSCSNNSNDDVITGKTYSRGLITDSTYKSEYLNLSFTAPEGYSMSTEDELNKLAGGNEGTDDNFDPNTSRTVYEMSASNSSGTPSISLRIERVYLSVGEYLKELESQMTSMSAMEFSVVKNGETSEIAGEKFSLLSFRADVQGIEIFQDYAVRKVDDVMEVFLITYTSATSDDVADLIDQFQPIS